MKIGKELQLKWAFLCASTLAYVLVLNFCLASLRTQASLTQNSAEWSLLQRGDTGLVVMMRHALAPGVGDPAEFKLGDCRTQRNLSAEGRAQAVRLGKTFKRHQIRVARVLSSQWCRCVDTAKLLNLSQVEVFPALNSFFENRRAQPKQTAEVRRFIIDNRNTQGVIIMVTHQVNITAVTGIIPQSGEAVVLKANQKGQVQLIGRLPAS